MKKRIGLFVVGLVVAVVGFWLYQYLTGAGWMAAAPKPVARDVARFAPRREQSYEFRDKMGVLKYLITAAAVDPVVDAAGKPVAGEFLAKGGAATFYSKDGRTAHIRADTCRVTLDQIPKSSKQATVESDLPPVQFRMVTLSGNVLLTVAAKPPGALPAKPEDGELTVAFEGDVDILPNQNLLTSPGDVHVRSEVVVFDGGGLNLSFNRDEQRVEYLRIDRGNQVIVRGVGKKAFTLDTTEGAGTPAGAGGAAGTEPAAGPVAATGPAATQVAAKRGGAKSWSYKLSFGDVVATVGKQSLTADRMFVLSMLGNANVNKDVPEVGAGTQAVGANGAGGAATRASVAANAPAVASAATRAAVAAATQVAATAPIGPAGPDDLVINWHGPMEMRPSGPEDVQLTGAKDMALEAVGTAEKPVVVHDGTRTVVSGRLWYHSAADRVEVEPGELKVVRMEDAALGKLECQGVSVWRGTKPPAVVLKGPGQFEVSPSAMKREVRAGAQDQRPTIVTWKDRADVELAAEGKNAGKETIRRAVLTGDVTVSDPAVELLSDGLDVVMARTGDAKATQALEHLVATGHVRVKYAREGAGLAEAGKPEGMTAKRLEIFTAPKAGTTVPEPSRVLATGDVVAWTYSDQKEEEGAGGTPAVRAGVGAGGAAALRVGDAAGVKGEKRLVRETIYTPRLDVALEGKAKGAPGEAGPMAGLAMGTQAGMKSLLASEGVKVEIEGFEGSGNKVVTATAQTLTVDRTGIGEGKAVLEGAFGLGQPEGLGKRVVILQGGNEIKGDKVLLDQKTHGIEVPGMGEANFVDAGKQGQPDAKVKITWTQRMTYDAKGRVARFTGNVVSKRDAGADSASELSCKDYMEVVLASGAAATEQGAAAKDTEKFERITAKGDVRANGTTYDPVTHAVLTAVSLYSHELRYSAGTDMLEIPGAGSMSLEDYRVDKPAAKDMTKDKDKTKDKEKDPDSKGVTGFAWNDSLVYTGHKGKVDPGTVKMRGDVRMRHIPLQPFQVAGTDPKGDAVKEMVLNAETLTAYLAQTTASGGSQSVSNPVGLGAGGDMKFSRAVAEGKGAAATLDLGAYEISGYMLDFDSVKNTAMARGKNGVDATARSPDKGLVSSPDDITWNLASNTFTIPNVRGAFQVH